MICWMSCAASAQHLMLINDTAHYCITTQQTRGMIQSYRENDIRKRIIREMRSIRGRDSVSIDILQHQVDDLIAISTQKDTIIDVIETDANLTEKELQRIQRREKWQQVWSWFRYVAIGIGAGAAGYGIGAAAH